MRPQSRLGRALVVLQVALSLVLLVGAGLLVRSLENLRKFNPGFNAQHVMLISMTPVWWATRTNRRWVFTEDWSLR